MATKGGRARAAPPVGVSSAPALLPLNPYAARETQSQRDDRGEIVGVQREAHRQERRAALKSKAGGEPYLVVATLVPDRTHVEEQGQAAELVLARRVEHPIPAGGRDVVLVPPAERPGIAECEALEKRCVASDTACHRGNQHALPAPAISVCPLSEISAVFEVAFEAAHTRA